VEVMQHTASTSEMQQKRAK